MRIDWVDKMRGIAILSVVIQHMANFWGNDFHFHKVIGISNMAVFFFISGFIMSERTHIQSWNDYWKCLRKKTIQLMVPFWVWPLVVNRYCFNAAWEPLTITDLISQWHKPTLWFLLTLYGFTFIGLGYSFIKTRYADAQLKKYIMGGALFLFTVLILTILYKLTGDFSYALLYLPYYVLGIIISEGKILNLLSNKIVGTISLICIVLLTSFWASGQTSVTNILVKIVVSISMISILYVCCTAFQWNKKIDSFIKKCGIYSMAIYCSHWPFTRITIDKFMLPQNEMIGLVVTTCFAIIASCMCIYLKMLVERLPLLDLFLFGSQKKNNTNTRICE